MIVKTPSAKAGGVFSAKSKTENDPRKDTASGTLVDTRFPVFRTFPGTSGTVRGTHSCVPAADATSSHWFPRIRTIPPPDCRAAAVWAGPVPGGTGGRHRARRRPECTAPPAAPAHRPDAASMRPAAAQGQSYGTQGNARGRQNGGQHTFASFPASARLKRRACYSICDEGAA